MRPHDPLRTLGTPLLANCRPQRGDGDMMHSEVNIKINSNAPSDGGKSDRMNADKEARRPRHAQRPGRRRRWDCDRRSAGDQEGNAL